MDIFPQTKVIEAATDAVETLDAAMDILPRKWFEPILEKLNSKCHEGNGHAAKKKPGRKAKPVFADEFPPSQTIHVLTVKTAKPRKKPGRKPKAKAEPKPETSGDSLPGVSQAILDFLAERDANAGQIVASLDGKFETKSTKPSTVIRSMLATQLKRGIIKRGKDKNYRLAKKA